MMTVFLLCIIAFLLDICVVQSVYILDLKKTPEPEVPEVPEFPSEQIEALERLVKL